MTKVPVYGADGKNAGEVSLPAAFSEPVLPKLIARAALADATWYFQPKGAYPFAGLQTSARYRGRKEDFGSIKNHGISRLPREVLPGGKFGKVKRIAGAVKGRRAHPPMVDKRLVEKINKKEYAKALRSAMAATASNSSVTSRGHKVPAKLTLPIVLDSAVEAVSKTAQAQTLFENIGIADDLARSKVSRVRTGVGSRKGGAKRARSVLVVVGNTECALSHAARNLAGCNVVSAKHLKVMDLAPGAQAGRLTAYTKQALEALGKQQ